MSSVERKGVPLTETERVEIEGIDRAVRQIIPPRFFELAAEIQESVDFDRAVLGFEQALSFAPHFNLSDEELQRLAEMYSDKSIPVEEVKEAFGIRSQRTFYDYLDKLGIQRQRKPGAGFHVSIDLPLEEIWEKYEAGDSLGKVCEDLSQKTGQTVSEMTAWRHLKKRGKTLRRSGYRWSRRRSI